MQVLVLQVLSIWALTGGTTPTEAISRPCTVVNLRYVPVEAYSRTTTLVNERFPTPIEQNSKAATVLNFLLSRTGETISRGQTTLNQRHPTFQDSISRAITVCDVGDLNADGQLTFADIAPFVDTLLDVGGDLNRTWASDAGCDLETNGLDVQSFVNLLLEQP